jgi:hypothetical protein
MQNIPRNEVLEKLEAGWKLRRKCWANKDEVLHKHKQIYVDELFGDDWEGEPSGFQMRHSNCSVTMAFAQFRNNSAKFVRRKNWVEGQKVEKQSTNYLLHIDSILANDWEVWA